MAPTFPCPRSHSALVHSSRQTDGGPSSCTSSPRAHALLSLSLSLSGNTYTLSYEPSSSLSLTLSLSFSFSVPPPPPVYLSVCLSCLVLSLSIEPGVLRLAPFFILRLGNCFSPSACLCVRGPCVRVRAKVHICVLLSFLPSRSLCRPFFLLPPLRARTLSSYPSLFLLLRSPRAGQRRLSVPKLHHLFQPNIGISQNGDITHGRGKKSPARIINLLSAGSKKSNVRQM